MSGVIRHAEGAFNDLCNSRKGPQISGKSCLQGTFDQDLFQILFLSWRQGWLTTGMGFGFQGFQAACFQRDAEEGDTSTNRATSQTPLPCRRSLPAIRRRTSSSLALPLGLMTTLYLIFCFYSTKINNHGL